MKGEKLREKKIHCQNEIFPMKERERERRKEKKSSAMTTKEKRKVRECEGSIKKFVCIQAFFFHLTRDAERKKKEFNVFWHTCQSWR